MSFSAPVANVAPVFNCANVRFSLTNTTPSKHIQDLKRGIHLLEGLKDCYDSLPAVNSDTSLPIITYGIGSFPNYRYSFLPYFSAKESLLNSYEKEIEYSKYPYGYEFEDCFIKHKRHFTHSTNIRECIIEKDSYMSSTPQRIVISYVPRSNTYIVQVSFDNDERTVFFKQTNKLIHFHKNEIKWNSRQTVSKEFTNRILKHIENIDHNLHYALTRLSVAKPSVNNLRIVLNNPFWKETQSLFLLYSRTSYQKNKSTYNLLKRCQYHYRKKRDHLDKENIFDGISPEFARTLKTTYSFKIDYLDTFRKYYNTFKDVAPEVLEASYLDDFNFYLSIVNKLDSFLAQPDFVEYVKSTKDSIKNLNDLLGSYVEYCSIISDASAKGYTKTLADFNNDVKAFKTDVEIYRIESKYKRTGSTSLPKTVVNLKEGDLILNPLPKDYVDLNLKASSSRYPIFNNKIIYADEHNISRDILENLPLSVIMNNAEVLKANGILRDELLLGGSGKNTIEEDIDYGW